MFDLKNLKKYLPEIINSLLVLAFGLFTYLYFEGQNWIGESSGKTLTNVNFFMESIALLIFDAGLICYAIKFFKLKIRWPFFTILLAALLFALIPVWTFPGATYQGRIVYTIDGELVGRYTLLTLMVFVSIFIFIFIVPQLIKNREFYKLYILISIGVGVVATLYSYISEPDVYLALFTNPDPYHLVPQSYTTHKNIYAYICVVAMLSEAFLLTEKEKPWRWAMFFYFFVNVCLTFSKTCIALGILIVLVFTTTRLIKMWKSHRKTAIIIISSVGGALLLALFFSLVDLGGVFSNLHTFTHFLFYELPGVSEGALGLRFYYFNVANEILSRSAFTRFFGFGYGNWNAAYYASYSGNFQSFETMDIAYAVDMLQFGFPGLAFSLGLWGLAIYLVVMQFINKSKYAFIDALMLSCFLLRTASEAGDLSYPNLTGTLYYLILVCPMIAENASFNSAKEDIYEVWSKVKLDTSKLLSPIAVSLATVLSTFILCLSFMANGGLSVFLLTLSIILIAASVLFPVVYYVVLVRLKRIDELENDREFLIASISAIFSLAAWAISFAVLTGNSSNLDGTTYLMVCIFALMVMTTVNGLIIMESLFHRKKEPEIIQKRKKKKR